MGKWIDVLYRWRIARKARNAARGVLFVSAGGLGDTVLFSVVLPRFLRLVTKDEPVTVLLRSDGAKTAFLFPDRVRVRTVDFKRFAKDRSYRYRVSEDLYAEHFRLIVDTDYLRHPDLDEAMIAAAAPSRAIAMEARPWAKHDAKLKRNRCLYSSLFDSGGPHVDKVVRWARFADWATGRSVAPPKVALDANALAAPATLSRPTVVIQPFSAVKAKQSPVSLYKVLIASLGDGVDVVLTGAPGDLDANPDYRALLDLSNVRFDSSTFEDVVPLLRAAALVISVDTAMMHLAVVVGAPTLCLASAAYVGEIVPYDDAVMPDNVRFLYQRMDCQGCLGACDKPAENGMYPCVSALSVDAVTAAARDMMAL